MQRTRRRRRVRRTAPTDGRRPGLVVSMFWEAVLIGFLGGGQGLIWAAALGRDIAGWAVWGAIVGAGLGLLIGLGVGQMRSRVGRLSAAFVLGTLVIPAWIVVASAGLITLVVRAL